MHFFFTVDVECYGGDYGQEVHGRGQGLDYLLERLAAYGIRASFFVEALGAARWGTASLRHICRLILEGGHEIHLHLHPKIARLPGFMAAGDQMWGYEKAVQERLFAEGLAVLDDCGVRNVSAFRAGDLAADENTLAAMASFGIRISSNRDLDTRCVCPRINSLFPVANDIARAMGITDLPVTAFRSFLPFLDGTYRHLEICALAGGEMTAALARMAVAGYRTAALLTHPGEFFRMTAAGIVPQHKNRRRLERLLVFLAGCQEIQVATMAAIPSIVIADISPPDVWLAPLPAVARMIEQASARLFTRRR